MRRKIKHLIAMIWWQFRKKKIKGDCLRGLIIPNLAKYLSYNIKLINVVIKVTLRR